VGLGIPPPEHLPWVASGDIVNKAYVKARTEAFKHASQRNKLLQGLVQTGVAEPFVSNVSQCRTSL
jgi:hypothetical protein